jgi:hypothetical protein
MNLEMCYAPHLISPKNDEQDELSKFEYFLRQNYHRLLTAVCQEDFADDFFSLGDQTEIRLSPIPLHIVKGCQSSAAQTDGVALR